MIPLLLVLLAMLVVFFGVTLWVRAHPLEAFVKMTRTALRRAGLVRKTLDLPFGRVVYWSGGSGEPLLVLVHGMNDQAGSWAPIAGPLARAHRVAIIDLPGHGESAPRFGPLPIRKLVDALSAVIERESSGAPVFLAGNSLGGWIAMLYAIEHPQRVARLVLEDASGLAWDASELPIFPKTADESRRFLEMVHGPRFPISPMLVETMLRLGPTLPQARVLQAGVFDSLVDARLGGLTMPVSLIWGEHDGVLSLAYAEALRSRIAGATLTVIDGAAHIPHRQKPAEFLAALNRAIA